MKNYLKLQGARSPEHFFPFETTEQYAEAYAAARELQPRGTLAVWLPLEKMPADVRCVGHSPFIVGMTERGTLTQGCANCGQTLPELQK